MALARSRLACVDALRGLTVAAMLFVNDPGDWSHVLAPFEHAAWDGCTLADLVFPFFLTIVGVSTALSVAPRLEAGADRGALCRAVLARAVRIVLLGLALNLLAHWALETRAFRPMGVLQRVGLCYAAVGCLALYTRARTQWLLLGGILLGYWALLMWAGPLTKEANLASRLDTALLGPMAYEFDAATGRGHDPEGMLSTLPAIATALIGLRAGQWLRRRALGSLALASLAALGGGLLWSTWCPLNKALWSSSYVLWTGGWALGALWLAHALIDQRGWPPLGRSLGANAITAYAGAWVMACALEGWKALAPLYPVGFGWMTPVVGPEVPSLVFAAVFTGFWWAAMALMDRRGIHISI